VNPAAPAVVSIGSVHAGSAPNVLPDRATLTGTLRATDADTRRLLVEEVRRVAESSAAVHRLRAEVSIELGPPPLVNAPEPAGWARRAVATVLGDGAIVPLGFLTWGAGTSRRTSSGCRGAFSRSVHGGPGATRFRR